MKKQKIWEEGERLIYETTQNKPDIKGAYPINVVRNRELLLLGGKWNLGKLGAEGM